MSANKKAVILLFVIFGILFSVFALKIIFIPNEISMKEGCVQRFEFNIPAEAAIVSSDISVPVSAENNSFLFSSVTLNAEKVGTADLRLSIMGIPLKNVKVSVVPDIKLVPSGETIGIRINTDGIMVLGIGEVTDTDNKSYMPCSDILKSGDLIVSANGVKTLNKEILIDQIEKSGGNVHLQIKRSGEIINSDVTAVKGIDGEYKIGVWVRDSTQGIGTVTFYNEETGEYGALGHGIADVDTNLIMSVKDGKIMYSTIKDIVKSEKGTPGELMGIVDETSDTGTVEKNTECGIFGKINDNFTKSSREALPIALKDEVKTGKAQILCNIDGEGVKEYDINIESINTFNSSDSKSMVIRVTDKRLLDKTNGIVQGMSGSPIIQNNKLVGAVTHVFVRDSTKGYGIFIQNMLRELNN